MFTTVVTMAMSNGLADREFEKFEESGGKTCVRTTATLSGNISVASDSSIRDNSTHLYDPVAAGDSFVTTDAALSVADANVKSAVVALGTPLGSIDTKITACDTSTLATETTVDSINQVMQNFSFNIIDGSLLISGGVTTDIGLAGLATELTLGNIQTQTAKMTFDLSNNLMVGGQGFDDIKTALTPLPAYTEGKLTSSLTTGDNDDSLSLAMLGTQTLRNIVVAAPGAVGDLTVQFFDGVPGGMGSTAITGPLYLNAQPSNGFELTGYAITTGTLGWRIAGWTDGMTNAYVNIAYNY